MNKYLKFEYWNTCDLGNIYYQGGQHFIFYLDADVGEPLHEDVEEGQENGDGDFIPTYRRQIKRYRIRTGLIPDFLIDAMQRMKLHDNIELTFKTGEVEQIYNVDIEPEWQFEKYAWQGTVTLTFDMDESITVGACCDNLTVTDAIPEWYWIATDGSDDTGDGHYTTPWKTLAYACTQVTSPGEVIHVKAGTYIETARSNLAAGVSIIGAGKSLTFIHSTYVATSSTDASIYLNSPAGSTIDGNQSISHLAIDGTSKTALRCIAVNYRNNVVLHDLIIEDFAYGGIRYYVSSAYPTLYATGNSVHDCTITNSAGQVDPGSNYPGGLRISGMNGFLCYNNYFDNTVSAAGNNGNSIAFSRNKKTKIHDNEFHRLDSEIDKWNFFFEAVGSSGDNEYYNNDHYGLAKVSFGGWENTNDVDCTYGFKVYNNNFYNDAVGARVVGGETQTYYGINLEGNKWDGVFIYNNYIQNFGFGIELSTPKGDTGGYWDENWVWNNVNVYYNIIDGIGYDGYNYGTGIIWLNETNVDVTGTFTNILIANNVIVNKDNGYQGIRIAGNGTMTGLDISNNIVYDFTSYGIYIDEHSTDGFALTNANITYNDMYSNGTDTVYLEGTIVQTNVDSTTGNITTNPTFVGATDFHLQAGSPCINAGVNVGLTEDYDGQAVSDPPEIGAYEY